MATRLPENLTCFSFEEIVGETSARCNVAPGERATREVRGVATDTRVDLTNKLFVALRGENFDGHDYLEQAFAKGAAAALVERDVEVSRPVFRVESTLDALGALGRCHRRRWGGTIVAVAGSAGKTTTRSAISALLDYVVPGQAHSTVGNLNNRIGVPMMLLGLGPQHRFSVLELGTNQRGEVATLAQIVEPEIAVLTLIDLEHTEGLGDLESVAEEEGDLLAHPSVTRLVVVNGDDPMALAQLSRAHARVLRFGFARDCDYRIVQWAPEGLTKTRVVVERRYGGREDRVTLTTRLVGEPGARACVAALALADELTFEPVSAEEASAGLQSDVVGQAGRLNVLELNDDVVVLDDTYNANPASMRSAIQTAERLAQARNARLLVVLGEMRELGAHSLEQHETLARMVATSRVGAVIAVGQEAEVLAREPQRQGMKAEFVEDAAQAAQLCLDWVKPGDVVLVKASRGVALERVVQKLASGMGLSKKGVQA